jgi:hypothetical protein
MDIDGMVADIRRLKTKIADLEAAMLTTEARLAALEALPLGVGPEGEGLPLPVARTN